MKIIFVLLFLAVSAQANETCKPQFSDSPMLPQIKEVQKILNNIEPTTRRFELQDEKVKLGDMVAVQLTPEAYDKVIVPQIEHTFSSKQELLEARAISSVEGLVVGSVVRKNDETGLDEVHLAILDEPIMTVYFVSKNMIDPLGGSIIAGHNYNQLKKIPELELDEDSPMPIEPESKRIH